MIMAYRQAFRLRDEMRESRAARALLIRARVMATEDTELMALARARLAESQVEYAGLLARGRDLMRQQPSLAYVLEIPEDPALSVLIEFYQDSAKKILAGQ